MVQYIGSRVKCMPNADLNDLLPMMDISSFLGCYMAFKSETKNRTIDLGILELCNIPYLQVTYPNSHVVE